MRAGIFGWSYPPGCSGPPDDGPEPPCQMCGEYEDNCKCLECKAIVRFGNGPEQECGAVGCLEHMPLQSLLDSEQLYSYLFNQRKRELERRSIAEAVTCEKCFTKIPRNFIDGMEYCEKCKKIVGEPEDFYF